MDSLDQLKYRAFLSYSHVDTGTARRLHRRLEGFRLLDLAGRSTPRGRVPDTLRPIFRDRHDFGAGESLPDATRQALDQSASLVVLCSPSAAKSVYVDTEVRLFKLNHPSRPIVPVIADTASGVPVEACIPSALNSALNGPSPTSTTPPMILAADMRSSGDGLDLATSKIVASIIGIQTDEVYRRADRERKRRALVRNSITTSFLAIFAISSFLYYRNYQNEAAMIDTAAACQRYLPAPSAVRTGLMDPLQLCMASLDALHRGAASDPRDAEALRLFSIGKRDEAEKLQVESAEEDLAAGKARIKKAAERFRIIADTAGYGDPAKALHYYRKAVSLDPVDWLSLIPIGINAMEEGRLSEAKDLMERVLPLTGDRLEVLKPIVKIALGSIYSQLGDENAALKYFSDCGAGDKVNWNHSEQSRLTLGIYKTMCKSFVAGSMERRGDFDSALKLRIDEWAFYEDLLGGGHIGWIGVEIADLTEEPANATQFRSGVRVAPLVGGPAADAGIKAGDIATSIDGQSVTTPEAFTHRIRRRPPGSIVGISILRGATTLDVHITVGMRPPHKLYPKRDRYHSFAGSGAAASLVTRLVSAKQFGEAERVARQGLEWITNAAAEPDTMSLRTLAKAHLALATALRGAEGPPGRDAERISSHHLAAINTSKLAVERFGELQLADEIYLSATIDAFHYLYYLGERDKVVEMANDVIAFVEKRGRLKPLKPFATMALAQARIARCEVASQHESLNSSLPKCEQALEALSITEGFKETKEWQSVHATLHERVVDGKKRLTLIELAHKSKASFEREEFAAAAQIAAELVERHEAYSASASGHLEEYIPFNLSRLAWYRLFARDFTGALEASLNAARREPLRLDLKSSIPHALMFLDRFEEARSAYLEYKGQSIDKEQGGLWEDKLLSDLTELEKRGVTHPFMYEVRIILRKN